MDRLATIPLSSEGLYGYGFGSQRHGALSLCETFTENIGDVYGGAPARHISAEFATFLGDIVANHPCVGEIHVVADNPAAHKALQVKDFLLQRCAVHLHFTPSYLAWLRSVERWLSKIEGDVLAQGVLTTAAGLKSKLMHCIRHCKSKSGTIQWRLFDPSRIGFTGSVH